MQRRMIASWVAQVLAAAILALAGFMKVTGAPDSVALFEVLGAEPWGRVALGVVELTTATLLLVPRTAAIGGLLAAGLMTGAVTTHLVKLGIQYGGDASLFVTALIALTAGATVAALRREQLPL